MQDHIMFDLIWLHSLDPLHEARRFKIRLLKLNRTSVRAHPRQFGF